jgi:hypothetical protein
MLFATDDVDRKLLSNEVKVFSVGSSTFSEKILNAILRTTPAM